MTLSASASAKIILFGEHAVVYGQPAIAVPVSSLRAVAEFEPHPGTDMHIIAEDLGETIPCTLENDHVLAHSVRLILDQLGTEPPSGVLRLRSQIPMASGLGSGTAISTALGRVLSLATRIPLSQENLNAVVYEIEKIHHGTPSGIDNTVIVYEQPVFFRRGQPPDRLHIAQAFPLIIADTGKPALTKVAVGDVRRLYNQNRDSIQLVLDEIGDLVCQAQVAVETGDLHLLGILMRRNHEFLRQLTVSSPELDRLVQAACDAGATGAKLSGGGRGGNMIAVAEPDAVSDVMQALRDAGAVRVFSTTVQAPR